MSGTQWSRDEYIVTLDLYLNHPSIVEDQTDPQIREVASLIDRSPGAVALRLANYRHIDPTSSQGMSHVSQGCRQIWEEYHGKNHELAIEAERARARFSDTAEISTGQNAGSQEDEARTDEALTEALTRLGQGEFRELVFDRYGRQCLICDISEPGLLVAAHILPWSEFENERGDPNNGLVFCHNHHRAFDLGMFTVSGEYEVVARPDFSPEGTYLTQTILERDGVRISFPNEPPSTEYLKEHNNRLHWWPEPDDN